MPSEAERRRAAYEELRQDRAVIESAAWCLRHDAVQQSYAGLRRKELALGFAMMLDTMALRLRYLDAEIRRQAVDACREFIERVDQDGEDYRSASEQASD